MDSTWSVAGDIIVMDLAEEGALCLFVFVDECAFLSSMGIRDFGKIGEVLIVQF